MRIGERQSVVSKTTSLTTTSVESTSRTPPVIAPTTTAFVTGTTSSQTSTPAKIGARVTLLDDAHAPPMRRLPALRDAMNDSSITPLAPSSIAVPNDVVATLAKAKRVLVIGHVPPDVDCAGSALGLARALQAFGKDAVACVDFELQGGIRAVDDHAALQRAADVHGPFDCVVLVDVADPARIGGAARFLEANENGGNAPNVVVIDHHEVSSDDVSHGARFIAPNVDAAGLLVASVVARLERELGPIEGSLRAQVHAPLVAGAYKDTEGFTLPGATLDGLRMFKHLVDVDHAISVDALEQKLGWTLARDAVKELDAAPMSSTASSHTFVVDHARQERALELARKHDARTTSDDVRGAAMKKLDRLAQSTPIAVALFEVEGGVLLSTRSREPGPALELAEALGGGGHKQKAGGFVAGTLVDVKAKVDAWLARFELTTDPRVRFQR